MDCRGRVLRQRKRKENRIFHVENRRKPKKKMKNAFDALVAQLKALKSRKQFCNVIVFENTVDLTINPNGKVTAKVNIWKAEELFIHIKFIDRKETVKIVETSFVKYSTNVQIKRLQNFAAHIERIGDHKERLFPVNVNWGDFIEGKLFENLLINNSVLKQIQKNNENKTFEGSIMKASHFHVKFSNKFTFLKTKFQKWNQLVN